MPLAWAVKIRRRRSDSDEQPAHAADARKKVHGRQPASKRRNISNSSGLADKRAVVAAQSDSGSGSRQEICGVSVIDRVQVVSATAVPESGYIPDHTLELPREGVACEGGLNHSSVPKRYHTEHQRNHGPMPYHIDALSGCERGRVDNPQLDMVCLSFDTVADYACLCDFIVLFSFAFLTRNPLLNAGKVHLCASMLQQPKSHELS
ncbi:hypothetical protein EK21DRAFT_84513 [Setomelanomma holmii]|uniref:Uncharacterized protein n=1 Tax=Setomelanomma holmii TaxID=210430 RepID=A0A9P4LPV0_9PLEO|nr:hypothetical protein EK21DRAFT_84513 [Setomelanomma holmii]